ncbi:hypothetical protein BC832DRAFT_461078 [Gaertneriomyces semiglobifer]|nr:hypothetical protein BC832DRAFT_461078 [Gaertneriomyces semiglobifer]
MWECPVNGLAALGAGKSASHRALFCSPLVFTRPHGCHSLSRFGRYIARCDAGGLDYGPDVSIGHEFLVLRFHAVEVAERQDRCETFYPS